LITLITHKYIAYESRWRCRHPHSQSTIYVESQLSLLKSRECSLMWSEWQVTKATNIFSNNCQFQSYRNRHDSYFTFHSERTGRPRGRSSSPDRMKNFPLLHAVQTGSGVHPTSYTMCTWVLSQGVKRPGREATAEANRSGSLYQLPHTPSWRSASLVERSNNFTFYNTVLMISQYKLVNEL
jgi:hypothetical protein